MSASPQIATQLIAPGVLLRLRQSTLFESLTDEQFNSVKDRIKERHCTSDEIIVDEQSVGDRMFIIGEGRVKITKQPTFGKETLIALLHNGDFFGGGEIIDGRLRSSRVVAIDECLIYELAKSEFDKLLRESHAFAIRLIHVLSDRLHAFDQYFVEEIDRTSEESQSELTKLRKLIEAAKILNSTFNLDKLLDIILGTAVKIVEADRGTLYLIDDAKQELWSKILKGLESAELRLPIGKGLAGHAAATGDVINIPDAYLDSRFNPEVDVKTGYRTKSILCVPMRNKDGKIIGVLQLFNKLKGKFGFEDVNILEALSIHASIAIENARLYDQERQKIAMEKDLQAAREVQMALLPKASPRVQGYDIAGITIPAQAVGGDYFDFITLDNTLLAITVGDVSGKGLPAALLMANLQANLRAQTFISPIPKVSITGLNQQLAKITATDKFVTLFFGILDISKNQFTFTNAGHNPPYLFSGSGPPRELTTGGIVLCIMEDFSYEEDTVNLLSGDVVVIYSDGVTEAINMQQEQFGEERLIDVVGNNRLLSANELQQKIISTVKTFAEGAAQADDITVVVIKRGS